MKEAQGEPLALPALPQALAHQRYRSDIAPILRHPNSFQPNASTIGVHDYFSLNAMAHNSLYSGLHQLYKVGVPKHNKPLRLAPLCIDIKKTQRPIIKLNQLGMIRTTNRGGNQLVGDADDVGSLMGEDDDEKYPCGFTNDHTKVERDSQLNQKLMELDKNNEDLKDTAQDMTTKATELSLIKAKARSGLLKGLRNGELEQIATSMENSLLAQEERVQKMLEQSKAGQDAEVTKQLEEQQEAIKAKIDSLQQIKEKAKVSLLKAARDGSLDEIVQSYNENGEGNDDKKLDIDQELGHLADDVEQLVRDGAKIATKMESSTKKGRDALLAAKRNGELEDIYNRMHTTSEQMMIISTELCGMQKKTKSDLLLAHRPDLLFKVYDDLGRLALRNAYYIQRIKQETFQDTKEQADSRSGQLSHTVKELDKIIDRLEKIKDRIDKNSPEFKENEKLLKPSMVRDESIALVQVGELIKTKTVDMNVTKEKARSGMLASLRKGELETIKKEQDEIQEKKQEIKNKAAHGLLKAVKDGNFHKILESYQEKLKEAHQDDDSLIAEKENLFRVDLANIRQNTLALWLRERRKQLRSKDEVRIKTDFDRKVIQMEVKVLIEVLEQRAKEAKEKKQSG